MSTVKYQISNELPASATKRNSVHMLPVSDWLSDLPENTQLTDLIEVLMKEGRPIGMFPISENSFLDMGEFEEMRRMEEILRSGGVS